MKKRLLSIMLAICMVITLIPTTAFAETGTDNAPSVTAYATKAQLMYNTFAPNSSGTAANIGKLAFGKNSSGSVQEWYILGQDTGVSGDNTAIFAAGPMVTGQMFSPYSPHDASDDPSDSSAKYIKNITVQSYMDCTYPAGTTISQVYISHYGTSELRTALRFMAGSTNHFTVAEQGLMNATPVTTTDIKNKKGTDYLTYTTTDKLYAPMADGFGESYKTIKTGSIDRKSLTVACYWSSADAFWLRSPNTIERYPEGYQTFFAGSYTEYVDSGNVIKQGGDCVTSIGVTQKLGVRPASNIDLSSVLFASAATAASGAAASGTIAQGKAMTLRLDGRSKNIGTVTYSTATGDIKAAKGNNTGDVALVVQGKDGANDWYYSKKITGTETVNKTAIKSALGITSDIDLSTCKIWLETTEDNVAYAVPATEATAISSVDITGINTPEAGVALDTEAACETTGVSSTRPQVTWTPAHTNAGYNTSYTASVTLTADNFYAFTDAVTATVSDQTATSVKKNADGTLTVTYKFGATAKRKIAGVTAPTVPTNNTFTTYYGYDGYDANPISVSSSELGTQATVTFEETVAPATSPMNVTWTIANEGEKAYDKTLGAANTFRWTIPASELTNYNASGCPGYDTADGTITGTVTITNKAATSVSITGTDRSISYTGAAIDVSSYFNIDTNAGAATYSLITGADGGTGVGSLDGTALTVTQTGTFKIKVNTAANGIYEAGEKTITLTISKGTIDYTAADYSGTYDGQAHSISVNVTNPEGTTVTYSTDGKAYGSANPSFTNAGTYTVYYRIMKDNYTTVEASKTVTISKKSVTITAENQNIVWGNAIDQSKYTVSENGLAAGDSIKEITLKPSTEALTEEGTIAISGVKIENAAGADVTGNYNITKSEGTLKIAHDTSLAPERIEAVKTKTSYKAGDTLNVDDITVRAYYEDGYIEKVTEGFETNAETIDMSLIGEKTLTVSYTKNDETKTKDITITVSHNTSLAPQSIDAVKNKTSYKAGDTLNVDDITVTAYYSDGYSEAVADFTTNAADIDMSKTGKKNLTVSYSKNGATITADITINVAAGGGGGSYIPSSQKPTVEAGEGVKVTLSADGTVATITVDDGYELEDVVLNGVSKGKVTEVKGLKTGDKLVVTAEKKPVEPTEPTKEEILAVLADQKLVARSKLVTMKNGKKAVLITWYNRNGEMMDFDGVEIYRSAKRNSGYGKKPIFTSVTGKYYNTAVKKGTKYYYKVRGFVIIDGQKYYTDYSLKAIRTVK
ncbi:MAG: bacterial Ig-like domain-containing protein [Anaerovoracaceae bacterium]